MAFNPFDAKEAGKYASEHARIRNMPEPKDVFTEDDCFNHLSPRIEEEVNNNPYFKAALHEVFKLRYDLNYHNGKIGLDIDDIENIEFFIKKDVSNF